MNYDLGGRLPSDTTHGEGWCVKATPQEHAHTHKYTPSGIPTCDSGQWASQEQEALISNSVIWLC